MNNAGQLGTIKRGEDRKRLNSCACWIFVRLGTFSLIPAYDGSSSRGVGARRRQPSFDRRESFTPLDICKASERCHTFPLFGGPRGNFTRPGWMVLCTCFWSRVYVPYPARRVYAARRTASVPVFPYSSFPPPSPAEKVLGPPIGGLFFFPPAGVRLYFLK
jgi:hypothetical protein